MSATTTSDEIPLSQPVSGLRPVNLRTDLAELADLIEMAFADTMDSNGRAAIREMRSLSHMGGIGLNLLIGMNDLSQGVGLGYVWVEDGHVIGNTSIYPAQLPHGAPKTWIIANVAVHPTYRGRGIARALMQTSMDTIRTQSRRHPRAILQVEQPNIVARTLYEKLGFVEDGTWTSWRRSGAARIPPPLANQSVYITQRTGREWHAELELASHVRPPERGGIGWLRPLTLSLFRRPWWTMLGDMFNMRSMERLIIRSDDGLRAAMWIESGFGTSSTQVTLLCPPDDIAESGEALLHLALRRYSGRAPLHIEHPADDEAMTSLLQKYHFIPVRKLVHMRWEG